MGGRRRGWDRRARSLPDLSCGFPLFFPRRTRKTGHEEGKHGAEMGKRKMNSPADRLGVADFSPQDELRHLQGGNRTSRIEPF